MYIFAFIHTNVHVGTFSSCTCGHISQLYPLWRPSSNPVAMSEWVSESHSVMLYSLWPHGLYSPWNSPGQNAGVGSCSLLQGIFPTQGSNPGLQHCRQILYHLSHQGSPRILKWVAYPFSRGSCQPRNWTRVSSIAGRLFTSWATGEYSDLSFWKPFPSKRNQASLEKWPFPGTHQGKYKMNLGQLIMSVSKKSAKI